MAPCGFRLDGAYELAAKAAMPACCRTDAEVWAVDADAFVVRPGPAIIEGVETFAAILHPSGPRPPGARGEPAGSSS